MIKVKVKVKNYIPEELEQYCIPINTIHFWKDNPRKNDEAAPKLAELIKVHGFNKPIIVWEKNMTTYAGNTALKAARILGMKEIPAILRNFASEAAAKAYGISDNKASEFSVWDDEALVKLMEVEEFSTDKLGFNQKELFSLISMVKAQSGDPLDIMKEWQGMPEYAHEDLTAFKSIIVHFANQKDMDHFALLIKQTITIATRSLWYPKAEIATIYDKRYTNEK